MPSAKTTTDHDEIREWVEARGGSPARVRRTGKRSAGDPGILRIDYPGFSGQQSLEQIDWDEWFDAFEKHHLAFLYQDRIGGHPSRFSKLVERRGGRGTSATSARRGGAKRTGPVRAKRKTATTKRPKRAATSKRTTARKRTTAPRGRTRVGAKKVAKKRAQPRRG